MKATLGWIREFVDVDVAPQDLAERLTHRGLECEALLEGALDGVVVGEILEASPHPKADRLKLCKVSTGAEVLSVVCGAPNARCGDRVPLAAVGARLPSGQRIEAAEIRGIPSQGMLCSELELQVGDDASGLWTLPREAHPGDRVDEAMALRDWVLTFELTPNRGDCLSILGLAHEVSAIVGAGVRLPDISLEEEGEALDLRFEVNIDAPDLCPRYVARLVDGTVAGPSPLWMRRRLQLVGQRPINNLVDVTNYVMWELGQPLHAFDRELLEERTIVVKRAQPGETFVSLDGQERHLTGEMLMIWDGRKPVAVAGVMGGENSEVRPNTRSVLIESAYFDPLNIRRTAKALGMGTEASRRFERGIDLDGCPRAADRAAQLMARVAGGRIAPGRIDAYPGPRPVSPISVRVSRVNELLGTNLDGADVRHCLTRLDLQVEAGGVDKLLVRPPTRRVDLTREVDLVEEVARVWGYERIPATLPRSSTVAGPMPLDRQAESITKEVLLGFGFYEIITYAFMDQAALDRLGLPSEDPLARSVSVRNPLRPDQGVMRTTLVPGILDAVRRNLHHKNLDLRLFEVGRVFLPVTGEALPHEPRRLGGVMLGARSPDHWGGPRTAVDLFDLKGAVEGLLAALRISPVTFHAGTLPPFLKEGWGAWVRCQGKTLGWMGGLGTNAQERFDLDIAPLLFELDLEALVSLADVRRRMEPLPRFPEVVRDLSLLVDRDISAGDLLDAILGSEIEWLREAFLVDVFVEGKKLPPGKKGLTFRIRYRSGERSLTDEEVNDRQVRLLQVLGAQYGVRLR